MNLVPTSSAILKRPRPDLVPIMVRPGRGHQKTPGHSPADLVPILKPTSSRPDTPSRDEVTPPPTSTPLDPLTSSHLVPDEVGTKSSDLVPHLVPLWGRGRGRRRDVNPARTPLPYQPPHRATDHHPAARPKEGTTMTTDRALCATLLPRLGDLWFSTDPAERARAKAYCAACPLRAGCADAGLANPKNRGVWGGLDTLDRRRSLGLPAGGPHPDDEAYERRPQPPRECGTEEAYLAHRQRHQTCDRCEEEHAARIEEQRRVALDAEHAKGGTVTGYQLHRKLGEVACAECRTAAVDVDRANRHAREGRAAA